MYAKKGWTKPIIKLLEGRSDVWASEWNKKHGRPSIYRYFFVPADVFKEIGKKIPQRGLEDKQNGSPTLGSFLRDADDLEGVAMYVVPEWREDERVTVDGAYVKAERFLAVLERWLGEDDVVFPNEVIYYPAFDAFYVWWD